ncbi:MAG: Rdx family protein [Alsobacter sp.]
MRARLQDQGVADVTMAPGTSGQFDVTHDGRLLYSKHLMGRFPAETEIDHWARTGEPEAAFAKVAGEARR